MNQGISLLEALFSLSLLCTATLGVIAHQTQLFQNPYNTCFNTSACQSDNHSEQSLLI